MAGLVLQIRGVRLAGLLAVPGAVALIALLRERYLTTSGAARILAIIALAAGWIGSGGLSTYFATRLILPSEVSSGATPASSHCLEPSGFAALAVLAPGRVAAPVDLGPYLLLMTPHAVIGAPYHRNGEGHRRHLSHLRRRPPDAARAIVMKRGIDLVVTCKSLTPLIGGDLDSSDSLKRQVASQAGTPTGSARSPCPMDR